VRYLLVGLGSLGRRRRDLLAERCIATVDPHVQEATYSSVEECPTESYDAAVISSPNEPKLTLVRYLLERGKHVMVDKPFLLPDDATADELAATARQTGSIWYTSYNHRFEPLVAAVGRHLELGTIGRVYAARLVYANGTVQNVRGTWRDRGLGVVEDLGCHLLDLAGHLLGARDAPFRAWTLRRHEAESFDHAVLASDDGRFVLEASFLSWRNTFACDVIGERGSLHLHGLLKWGGSELVVRERLLPSGVPREHRETSAGPDHSWAADLVHFERRCQAGETSVENDRWISQVIRSIAAQTTQAEPRSRSVAAWPLDR
jgi:predicted dehydrogenase